MPSGRVFLQVFVAFLLGTATLAALLATEDGYGYALDEATYRWVAQESRDWSTSLGEPSLAKSLNPFRIEQKCHFLEPPDSRPGQPHSNFNLPASIHVLNTGWLLGGWRLDELSRLRFGSELLFALTIGGLVWKLSGSEGLIPAVGAGLGVVLCPRVFGHAHLAATETTLVCFWIWAVVAVANVVEHRGTITAAAIAIGLLAATKLTAWPACAMMVVWAVVSRTDRRFTLAFWLIAGSAAVVYVLTPNFWHDPINGLQWYLLQAADNPWKIPAYFGGRTYSEGMPWWSGLAVLFATTPIAVLLLSAFSLPAIRKDRLTELLWLNVALLMSMRVGGLVPSHDVERQFLPAMALLGMLAGLQGGRWVQSLLQRTAVRSPSPFSASFITSYPHRGPGFGKLDLSPTGTLFLQPRGRRVIRSGKAWLRGLLLVRDHDELRVEANARTVAAGKQSLSSSRSPRLAGTGALGRYSRACVARRQAGRRRLLLAVCEESRLLGAVRRWQHDGSDRSSRMQANGPAIRELRMHGVRMASLHRA